jgi:tetratricopeptide (TPR) repeat protein
LYTLGDIYVNESVWDLAARAYELAIAAKSDQSPQRPIRAVEVLAQRGALTQARNLLNSIEGHLGDRLSEEDRIRMLRLEARVAVAENRDADSVAVLEEIVALDPLDGQALILLGQHYAGIDEPERAIFYLERAQSLEEFEADARVRHAQVLVAQSNFGDAVRMLERAQQVDPRDDVGRYLDQVKRIARTGR